MRSTPDRSRLLNIAGVVLLVVLVTPFAAFAVPQLVGATESYVVVSNSMAPKIGAGAAVFVYDTPPENIEEGDVITFRTPNGGLPTTHQVVEVVREDDQLRFRTRGINNEEPDDYVVPSGAVIGEVGFAIPYLGILIELIGTPAGTVALVIVPAVALIVTELVDLVRMWRGSRSKADSGTAGASERSAPRGSSHSREAEKTTATEEE